MCMSYHFRVYNRAAILPHTYPLRNNFLKYTNTPFIVISYQKQFNDVANGLTINLKFQYHLN